MAKFPSNPLYMAYFGLLLSITFNLSAIYVFRQRRDSCGLPGGSVIDDSNFSYVDDDHPHQLPVHIPQVALRIENSERFGLSDFHSWADWRTTDLFPNGNGFVHLGPEGRSFGVSMFHQMHCLQMIRSALINGDPARHTRHCLNLMRQAILCASDTTLDHIDTARGTDGVGVVHVCRDWRVAYNFVEENQLKRMKNKSNHSEHAAHDME